MRFFEQFVSITNGFLEWCGRRTAPDVAPANKARAYYDRALGKFLLSKNLGAYAEVLDASSVTATAAELNTLGGQTGYPEQCAEVTFTETAGAGTWTGSISIPAGATIVDVIVNGVALWTSQTSATLKVGDVADDDGFFTGVDLKATDLLAGESISLLAAGGKEGAYIANSQVSPRYSATARIISGIITKVGSTGTGGRTRLTVLWTNPTASAATKA